MADLDPLVLLRGLGRTPDEVAASLLALDCRGVPGSAARCPVAEYLRCSGLDAVTVYEGVCAVGVPPLLRLPDAVVSFVVRFDRGEYPGLVADEP